MQSELPQLEKTRTIVANSTGVLLAGGKQRLDVLSLEHPSTGTIWFKIYDKATAPVFGDTPVMTYSVKASTGNRDLQFPGGVIFKFGIGVRCTLLKADNDVNPPPADGIVNIQYH